MYTELYYSFILFALPYCHHAELKHMWLLAGVVPGQAAHVTAGPRKGTQVKACKACCRDTVSLGETEALPAPQWSLTVTEVVSGGTWVKSQQS